MPLTLVMEGDDEETIGRRLCGGRIGIDGFLVNALGILGVDGTMLRSALMDHRLRADRRSPVALPLPYGYALFGELHGGRFEADRLEMDRVIWFAKGAAGTPHVVVRRAHAWDAGQALVGRPLDVGSALPDPLDGPIVRSAVTSPVGWLYMDVDALDSRI